MNEPTENHNNGDLLRTPDPERDIAMASAAGREAIQVRQRILRQMTEEQRFRKAVELTETTRQIMRDGLRDMYPEASEEDIQRLYVDRLLSCHGTSRAALKRQQPSLEI